MHMQYEKLFNCKILKYFSRRLLPYSVHDMDSTQLMSGYLRCCFILTVWCVALSIIYITSFRPGSEVRIINFLIGFSMLLITTVSKCFTGFKLNLSPQSSSEGSGIISVLQMGNWQRLRSEKNHQIWLHILRHKFGFIVQFRLFSAYCVQKTALTTSASGVLSPCLEMYPHIPSV